MLSRTFFKMLKPEVEGGFRALSEVREAIQQKSPALKMLFKHTSIIKAILNSKSNQEEN